MRKAPPDPRLLRLADATAPTDTEVERLLARRITRADAELRARMHELAEATEPTWVEEVRAAREAARTAPMGRDPRARTWTRLTEPATDEVAAVRTSAPPPRIATSTLPSELEVARVVRGAVPEAWVLATEPTEDEIRRLCARRAEVIGVRPSFGWRWPALGTTALFAAASAAVLLWVAWPTGYGTPELAVGQIAEVDAGDVVDLGPSIDLLARPLATAAQPRVHIAQADVDGTVVDLLHGGTRFEVDPEGAHRALTVRAGDVAVHVRGTIFTVDRVDEHVRVSVVRGKVEVETREGSFFLTAGSEWTNDDDAAAVLDALEPPTEAAIAVTAPPEPIGEPVAEPVPEPVAAPEAPTAEPAPRSPEPRVERVAPAPTVVVVDAPAEPVAEVEAPPAPEPEPTPEAAPTPEEASEPDVDAVAEAEAPVPPPASADDLAALSEIRRRLSRGDDPTAVLAQVDRYLADRPDDRLLALALELRLDVVRRTGDALGHERAISDLLPYADPRRVTTLHLERASLRIRRGELRSALGDYHVAQQDPGPAGLQALIGVAKVSAALGRTDDARAAMREALRRAPDAETEERLQQMIRELGSR